MACAGTAASSSSSAARESGHAGVGAGPGGVRDRAGAPAAAAALTGAPLSRSDELRRTTWLHPRTGEPVNSGHMIRSGGSRAGGVGGSARGARARAAQV